MIRMILNRKFWNTLIVLNLAFVSVAYAAEESGAIPKGLRPIVEYASFAALAWFIIKYFMDRTKVQDLAYAETMTAMIQVSSGCTLAVNEMKDQVIANERQMEKSEAATLRLASQVEKLAIIINKQN